MLNTRGLQSKFLEDLKDNVLKVNNIGTTPLEISTKHPLPALLRVYIFNATNPPGGRPLGEYKIQIRLPGQSRGERTNFRVDQNYFNILAGYIEEYDIYVLWDADLHSNIPYAKNVQVKGETIYKALRDNFGIQERYLKNKNKEFVIAGRSEALKDLIVKRYELTLARLLEE